MSREGRSIILSLVFLEKISGFILFIIGAMLAYYANANLNYLGAFGFFFLAIGVLLVVAGLLMILAKVE